MHNGLRCKRVRNMPTVLSNLCNFIYTACLQYVECHFKVTLVWFPVPR